MRRLMLTIFLLMAVAALTCSHAQVKLNGSDGMALLKTLTSSAPNLANSSPVLANSSPNLAVSNKTSGDLWSWGSRPHPPPESQTEVDYLNDSDITGGII
ncbi:MAG TPA: hypothetical protein VN455_07420 [Methanotrichaceae archaeon]|nr:hypothetical protein [Methanotrichaceae archaeon]